ncbi:hypothetical protein Y032_0757g2094 [Ancylostoma ceylanicum]|nr:hypothetical protein Y032_0757g2094 [Ancylostoma ceylanicum]
MFFDGFLVFLLLLTFPLILLCGKKNAKGKKENSRPGAAGTPQSQKKQDEVKQKNKKADGEDAPKSGSKKKDEKDESKKEGEKKDQEEKKEEEKKEEEKKEEGKKEEEKKEEKKKDDAEAKKKFEEDPNAKLDISPMELKWEFEQGQNNIKISNNSKVRFAIKVRCTDTDLYTVSPVTEFVDVGKSINIAVVRAKGPLKKDKIVLCSKQVPADEPDAAEAFKTGVPHVDVILMDRLVRV